MPEQEAGAGTQTEGQQQTNQSEESEEDDEDPTTWKPERAAQTIKAQRDTEKDLKRKLAAAEQRAKDAVKDATKTAAEQTAERLTALEQRVVTSDLREALTRAGALNPAVAVRLIDRKGLDPESGDYEAQVVSAVKDVKVDAPELFKSARTGSADGGPRGKTGGTVDMNQLIRQAAGRT